VFIEKLEAFDTSENLMFRKKIFGGQERAKAHGGEVLVH
jgi:hypothetical protein